MDRPGQGAEFRRRLLVRLAVFAAVVWAAAGVASGQSASDGGIAGRVLTAAGDRAARARVVAREIETGVEEGAVTDAHGEFMLVRLPEGEYALRVERAGTSAEVEDDVDVTAGDVARIELRLAAGGGAAEVESSDPVAGDASASGNLPGERQAEDELAAGAGGLAGRGIRLDGMSAEEAFNGERLGVGIEEDSDGATDTVRDPAAGVGSGQRSVSDRGERTGSSYAYSQQGVREFRQHGQAGAAAYGAALYGHGAGAGAEGATRSGGASLHGQLFYTVRNSAWAAVNPFSVATRYADGVVTSSLAKPADLRQQFGGSLGGTVRWGHRPADGDEARVHFFDAYDQMARNFPAVSSPGYAGFYALTPTQTALMANRGVKAAQINSALNYIDSLSGPLARSSNQSVNFARLDWRLTANTRGALEYNRARWSLPGGARTGAVVDRGVASVGSAFGSLDAGLLRWVQLWRGGFSNEVRVQAMHELQYESPQTPLPQEPNIGPGGLPPEVAIGPDGFVFGTPAALGQRAYPDERRLEAADVLAWVGGRHLVQVGGDLSTANDFTDSLNNADGTFSYDSGATGGKAGGLVDWITDYTFSVNAYPNGGCPSINAPVHDFCFRSYSQSFGQQSATVATQDWAAFAQDDWRVGERLTLHAGVRYEYQALPLPQQPNGALDAVFGARGATSVFPADRNNFGPRVGLEWSPSGMGGGVMRAGYGVYFGRLPGATLRAALLDTALPASVQRVRILPRTVTACPQMLTVGFGYPCSFTSEPAGVVTATTSAMVFDRRFRLPMVQQGTLSVEHEIGGGVLGSLSYDLNIDRQLTDSVDINIAPSASMKEFQLQGGTGAIGVRTGEVFFLPVYTSRVSTAFGPVTDVESNAGASYNGVTLEARRGIASARSGYGGAGRGVEFHAAWTWSKAIDFGQSSGATPRQNGQLDPFNVRYDKGLSALNFPHRAVVSAVWSPRGFGTYGEAHATAGRAIWRLADGWTVAGIFTEASGRGYSYDVFGGTRLAGGRESINGSGGSAVLATVGRNTLRLPDSANLDLRLGKTIPVTERVQLRGTVDAFNVMNHVNYSGITQRAYLAGVAVGGVTPLVYQDAATVATEGLNVLPFGAYTAAGTDRGRERQIQFGVRVEF